MSPTDLYLLIFTIASSIGAGVLVYLKRRWDRQHPNSRHAAE